MTVWQFHYHRFNPFPLETLTINRVSVVIIKLIRVSRYSCRIYRIWVSIRILLSKCVCISVSTTKNIRQSIIQGLNDSGVWISIISRRNPCFSHVIVVSLRLRRPHTIVYIPRFWIICHYSTTSKDTSPFSIIIIRDSSSPSSFYILRHPYVGIQPCLRANGSLNPEPPP